MQQLTLKEIYEIATDLLKSGEDLGSYPVYLGDDDELNGIHCGWYANIVTAKPSDDNSKYFIEMINDDPCNIPFKNKAIVIS